MPGKMGITLPLAAVGLGALLVGLAVPRLLGEAALLPGSPMVESLKRGESGDASHLQALRDSRIAAQAFLPASRTELDLGLVWLTEAQTMAPGSRERTLLLDSAIAAFRSGLASQPRETFAWSRLAYALSLRDGHDAGIAQWRMSIETSPAEPSLDLWRVEFG